jgi:hypothetical protein
MVLILNGDGQGPVRLSSNVGSPRPTAEQPAGEETPRHDTQLSLRRLR